MILIAREGTLGNAQIVLQKDKLYAMDVVEIKS